jgi:CubicO group peptidase (beta-lactamase class C family)
MSHRTSWIVGLTLSTLVVGVGCAGEPSSTWSGGIASTGERTDVPRGSPAPPAPVPPNAALDEIVRGQLDRTRSPGLAAAIVKGGELKWANGFGLANIADQRPVTVDTLFLLASTAKTITAAAVMQLVERGVLSLDAPIDGLPFAVQNPTPQTKPVTVRTLLTHTSSILDPDVDLYRPGDTQISLERYLRGSLVPGGEFFGPSSWAPHEPGARYAYSNTGVTLLGYLVEVRGGGSFESYTRTHLFEPLGMRETAWRLSDLDPSHIAMPYEGKPGAYAELGLYGYPDYPAGLLRTSVRQLATFLRMFINGGELDGVRILAPETVASMMKVEVPASGNDPDQGLIWYYEQHGSRRVLLHDGQDPGAYTIMGFDPQTKVGAIVLSNGDAESTDAADEAIFDLFDRLLAEGETL